mmetsp:Transcript_51330/g.77964  ORF Transcript_51330/g.77964 Transcript_51330/m.77964 type:complete len:265 (-) Transcript_51330:135-929(-)|eukprot:CAMPEP_0117023874 /NCGR_PEP_ID=MMETSP0472-20121206/17780_1 /TAXON_ID=693140 ORGANISM="Tiarina fusus, Strain LIS" /NCGR_SAMPLE_ID=MMETSP0472 /ASSEMBLY_ACC=CAM_ASM_000603 /LENGTH=264 /DNA_ID=CAMNT_0004730131 /DNA_START=77 /DNA_END=874 /DNA_ORIENTATION=-
MNIEIVSPTWSPTKARLSRRRNKAEKLQLDLSAHITPPLEKGGAAADKNNKNNNANNNSNSILNDSFSNIDAAVETLTKHQRQLLTTLQDPSQPIRDRVEAEIALLNDPSPDVAQIMKDAQYTGSRKTTLQSLERTEQQEKAVLQGLLKEEATRDEREKMGFAKKRQERRQEERERLAREYKAQVDAKQRAANQFSKDAATLKELAKKTKEKVTQNAKETSMRKQREEEKVDHLKQELLATEENDVLRKLKEARIEQRDIHTFG